jgi:eukaryotic-like serine/threonine-protein kinase
MLAFLCPSCHKQLQLGDQHAGRKVQCPGCGHVSSAPLLAPPVAEASSPTATLVSDAPAEDGATKFAPETRGAYEATLTEFLAPPKADDELGRLGKYRILSILGHGGMGVVYKAEDSVVKRTVALKVILPSLGAAESIRKRFLREARTMGQLEHDHVIRLYDIGEDRGVPYMAMEFLIGEPLDQRLKHERVLPLAETLRIGREIAEGLAAAHARDLIHRDIKPANIFLEASPASSTGLGRKPGESRVKILDFGLARAVEEESRITQSGAILGSPGFMAPEQTRGEKADFRSDLFSLGVVLYRMCTGAHPFVEKDALSTMMAVATKNPVSPQIQNLDVPGELSDLIMRLMDKDPANRGASAQALVETLQQIESQVRGESVVTTPRRKSDVEIPRNQARPPVAVAAPPVTKRPSKPQFPWLLIAAAIGAAFLCLGVPLLIALIMLL